jgi:tetratricopeptide (TPR) repeat protein
VAVLLLVALISFCAYWLGLEAWAWYQVRATHKALAHQDYPAAWEHITKALKVRSRSAELHLLAARVARVNDKYNEANDHMQRCFELQGGTSEPLQLERLMLQAQSGRVQEVFQQLSYYVAEDNPAAAQVLEALCVGFFRQGIYNVAITTAEFWLKREPDNIQALYYHGMCAAMQGAGPIAAQDLERAQELAPERDDIRRALAHVYLENNDYPKAAPLFERLLDKDPDDAICQAGMARCKIGLNRLDEAEQFLDSLIKNDTADAELLTERGKVAYQLNQPTKAVEWYRKAIAANPNYRQAYVGLQDTLNWLGKTDEAAEVQRQRRAIDDDMKRHQELMEKVSRPQKVSADVYCELGEILMRRGPPENGVFWLYKALEENRGHQPTHKALAEYWEKKGDTKRAEQHRSQLRSMRPPPVSGPPPRRPE